MQKTKVSAIAATFLVCFVFWVVLDFSFKLEELLAGAIVSLLVALFSARFFIHEDARWFFNAAHFFAMVKFWFCTFIREMINANISMAKICFGGCKKINPGIVKVPVDLKSEYGQAALANAITMTPGTITLDIAEDADGKTWYYIHWIDVKTAEPEAAGEAIKGRLERGLRRVWE